MSAERPLYIGLTNPKPAPVVEPEFLERAPYTWDTRHRFILDATGAIVGRLSGNPGAYWYQLAAKPYDHMAVPGFATLEAGFEAACNSLLLVK